jgi:hypothetical protein
MPHWIVRCDIDLGLPLLRALGIGGLAEACETFYGHISIRSCFKWGVYCTVQYLLGLGN